MNCAGELSLLCIDGRQPEGRKRARCAVLPTQLRLQLGHLLTRIDETIAVIDG